MIDAVEELCDEQRRSYFGRVVHLNQLSNCCRVALLLLFGFGIRKSDENT